MVNNRVRISMKKMFLLMVTLASLSFFMTSCSDPYEPTPDPTEMLGDVMFWMDDNPQYDVAVTLRNSRMYITKYYPSSTPNCGNNGCATFENIPIGTYSFHAENKVYTWNGEVTIRYGECSKMKLNINKGKTLANENVFDDYETTDVSSELSE